MEYGTLEGGWSVGIPKHQSCLIRRLWRVSPRLSVASLGHATYPGYNWMAQAVSDSIAEQMLTAEEYDAISRNMAQGIHYFAPGFQGAQEEALQFIVNRQPAPSVLARGAFCERAIENAVQLPSCQESGMTDPAGVGYCLTVRKG